MNPSALRSTLYLLLVPLWVVISSCSLSEKKPPVDSPLQTALRPELRKLGARNWIVISEAAFPIHSREGLDVIYIDSEIPELVDTVESLIEETHHLKPRVFLPAEISHIDYDYAPGVKAYRKDLQAAIHGKEPLELDHAALLEIIKNTSKSYRVLVIKSRTALPYSSVFMELGTGYWSADSESHLRNTIDRHNAQVVDKSPAPTDNKEPQP